jgi:RNA polymerase sigma-70 factor (ECF subfamily)
MDSPTDILLARLRGRDPHALAELYDRFGTYVYRVAFSIVRDRSTAENLTQETFLYLWNRIAAYDASRASLVRWVGLVARSRALDHVRSAEYRMGRLTGPLNEETDPPALAIQSSLEQAERIRLLSGPWKRLKPGERQALRLAYYSGLSQSEIAERLNRPLGTVKTWMRSGLQSLRAALEGASAF